MLQRHIRKLARSSIDPIKAGEGRRTEIGHVEFCVFEESVGVCAWVKKEHDSRHDVGQYLYGSGQYIPRIMINYGNFPFGWETHRMMLPPSSAWWLSQAVSKDC